jgi:hypothetical protein
MEAGLKENLLEASLKVALHGHDLAPWEQVDERGLEWQAFRKLCGRSVWVSSRTMYSLLEERCPGDAPGAASAL